MPSNSSSHGTPSVETQFERTESTITDLSRGSPEKRSLWDRYEDGLVTIGPDNPENPQCWHIKKKLIHTVAYSTTTLCAQFGSTVISPGVAQIGHEFHRGLEVATLGITLYLVGNGFGALIFAPLSELHGRKIGVFLPQLASSLCILITANLENLPSFLVFRFIAGLFAAAPIVSSGGAMADLWNPNHRPAALALYAVSIVAGSIAAPVFGSLLVTNAGQYGWRWSCWLAGLLGVVISLFWYATLSETYLPTVEMKRALHLRHQTHNWHLHAKQELVKFTLHDFLVRQCQRPLMLFLTPIVFCLSFYSSYVFGAVFLLISSVGPNFAKVKHFKGAAAYCPLFAQFTGFMIGSFINILCSKHYQHIAERTKRKPEPEVRLLGMMIGGWCMQGGFFLYGWTLRESIHWFVPLIGLAMVGCGIACILQGCIVYLVDVYSQYAASANAANVFLRSMFGGVFPLFTRQMYDALGVGWGSSLVGFMACVMLPMPYLFYIFGKTIRQYDPFKDKIT